MKMIRITGEGCLACMLMMEVMRRVMPEFPQIEIEDLDCDLDEEDVQRIHPDGEVPYLLINGQELVGAATMGELRSFLLNVLKSEQYP